MRPPGPVAWGRGRGGQLPTCVRDTPLGEGVKPPQRAACFQGWLHFGLGGMAAVGRRGIKEYRAPEALALIAADRQHVPLVCPSCATRSIVRVPRRRGAAAGKDTPLVAERVTMTCQTCGRHASYI